MKDSVRLGAGSGFAGDRIDPAVTLVEQGALDYLIFECLGERTIAAANARSLSGGLPYDPLLERRLSSCLPGALRQGTVIVTNGGAADPLAAARAAARLLPPGERVAAVLGDEVMDLVRELDPVVWENGRTVQEQGHDLVSANAYIGAAAVNEALKEGPRVVIGGRLADPSLYLGPLAHEFGWDLHGDPAPLAAGTLVGHLLECAGQVTGGYFADPVTKPVSGMASLGFPLSDVRRDGSATLTKVAGTGGMITTATVTEQLLYEVNDPAAYITPDVVADFSNVSVHEVGQDRVRVSGAGGADRTDTLKVTLGFRGGWLGEGQISYAGPRAKERAELAAAITTERLQSVHGLPPEELQVELIGTGSAFRGLRAAQPAEEVRLRVSAVLPSQDEARAVGWEVESLYTNGPAGGGGARTNVSEVLAVRSCLVPRDAVPTRTVWLEGTA